MSALKGNPENAISGKQEDSIRKEILLQGRRHKMTEKDFRREVHQEEAVFLEGDIKKKRADITLEETVRIRQVIIGTLPYVKNHKTESGCKFGDKFVFRHNEVDSQPNKKPKKSGGKGSVALLKNSKQLIGLRIPGHRATEEVYSTEKRNWDPMEPSDSPVAHYTT